jgi:hypothetical protein
VIASTRSRVAAGVAVLTLVAAACGGGGSSEPAAAPATDAAVEASQAEAETPVETDDPAEPPAEPASEPAPGVVVPAALEFDAALVGGGAIDARALAGKPTVFWFWAPT